MKTRYIDLIEQTFDFPKDEFEVEKGNLLFNGINLLEIIKKEGTPLRITYLPVIGKKIEQSRQIFHSAFVRYNYGAKYHYSYCTKSSHFSHIIEECLKHDVDLETSSAFDISIIFNLHKKGLIDTNKVIICNGFKPQVYLDKIVELKKMGFNNIIPVIDNREELLFYKQSGLHFKLGIRIASEEDPKFEFYTSRLGVRYKDIIDLYADIIAPSDNLELKMLHFFVNTGIKDSAYYWNELHKCLEVYGQLAKVCSTVNALDIGGGFPVKNSLGFQFDYAAIIDEIIYQIKEITTEMKIPDPDIYTEFGSFTVAETGIQIYSILNQKEQNDKEKWNIIDGSFITTLPDSWAINKRFIMLPITDWEEEYERVFLGGITCDGDDYYNSEQHVNAIYLPKFKQENRLIIGFFNIGAYQEAISGYGGVKHCLIPSPKHIIITENTYEDYKYHVFNEEQSSESMLKILGYETR